MKLQHSRFLRAMKNLLCAGTVISMALASGVAMAQDEDEEEGVELDRVVVTGSRIKRVDMEGVSPVITITREEMVNSGVNSVQDYFRTLTVTQANNGDDFNNSFANGTSTVNLRGLGGNATLVLLNGRRITPYGQGQNITEAFVDLNSIPFGAIERIEILKDGASALYGADAVAGVINIIMRSDYEGAEYNVGYQSDTKGDAPEFSAGVIIGGGNDTTHWTTIFNYVHRENLFYRDRELSKTRDFTRYGGNDARSSAGFPGTIYDPTTYVVDPDTGAGSVTNFAGPGCGTLPGTPYDSNVRGSGCALNFNDFINFYPESERFSFMNMVNHEISQNINLYWDFSINYNNTTNIAAPSPFFGPYTGTLEELPDDLPIEVLTALSGGLQQLFPATNPNNPYGYDVGIRHRAISLGPRTAEINSQTYFNNVGIEGYLGDSLWDYDAGFSYSRNDVLVENHNSQDAAAMQRYMIGSLDPAGSGDMIYYDPFAIEQDPRVFSAINITYENRNVSDELTFYSAFTGPVWEYDGGEIGAAVGIEYRETDLSAEADPLRNTGGLVGTGRASDTFGDRNQTSIFAELAIPIGPVEIQLAARYEDYSDFGSTTKPKIGIKWNITEGLLIRGSWGESFRAPSLFELFGGVVSSFPSGLIDPARCMDPLAGPGENGNAPDLTPVDCGNGQHQVNNGGNENLQPEEAESWSFGVVWEPTDDLYLQLDYWKYEHENIITQLGNQTILNLNDPTFVHRAVPVNGQVLFIDNGYINGAYQKTDGIDFYVTWGMDLGNGRLTLSNELTWTNSFEFETFSGAVFEGVGGRVLGDIPEYKDNFTANYGVGNHSVQAIIRYRSGLEDHFNDMDFGSSTDERCGRVNSISGGCNTGSFTTVDASYTWSAMVDASIQVGCINCFDSNPPKSILGGDTSGFFTSVDDPRGMVLFARWTQGF